MNNKAFTLVELLAVIVVLAIILAIALPRIYSIIESAEKSSFVASTKLLINAVKNKLLEDETFDITTINKSNLKTLLNIDDDNYSYISFKYDSNNKIVINAVGTGKWANLISCGNYEDLSNTECIVKDGLVLYLDAGNRYSYPGYGNTWYDLSGNGNNGNLVNGVGYNNGGSMIFDGINDYVDMGGNNSYNLFPISISFWTKYSENQVLYASLIDKYSTGSANGWQIFIDNNNRIHSWYFGGSAANAVYGGGVGQLFTPDSYNDGKWHHVTVIYNILGGFIYIDGTQKATLGWTGTPTISSNNFRLAFGQHNYSGGKYFNGNIGEVQIYNRALSLSEIQQNYNALKYRYGL